MPYITEGAKDLLARGGAPRTAGELTYCFTVEMLAAPGGHAILKQALQAATVSYLTAHDHSYGSYASILGALVGAASEWDRRMPLQPWKAVATRAYITEFYEQVVVPYEDAKIRENGDVYP